MKNNMRYFKFHLRAQLPYMLIVTVLSALLAYSTAVTSVGFSDGTYRDITLTPITFIVYVLSVLTPMVEFARFKKRSDLDSLFSVPVERRDLLGIHFLSGLITNSIALTAGILVVAIDSIGVFEASRIVALIPYWLFCILIGALMYGFFTFLFYEGNTTADGVVFMLAHTYGPNLFAWSIPLVLSDCFKIKIGATFAFVKDLTPIMPLSWLSRYYAYVVNPDEPAFFPSRAWNDGISTETILIVSIFYLLCSLAAIFAFFRWSVCKRVEKTGEISQSWFGYRTLLPMVLFALFSFTGFALPLLAVVLAAAVGGYAIYRRSFRLKLGDWLTIAGFGTYSIVISIIYSLLHN